MQDSDANWHRNAVEGKALAHLKKMALALRCPRTSPRY